MLPGALTDEWESGYDPDLLPLDEVTIGDEDRFAEKSYQNFTDYDPSPLRTSRPH
jgi:hypothetical protein